MEGFASLRVAIRNHIDGHASRPFAVLDFDGTCIVNDVAEATLAYICRNRLLRRGDLLFSRTQSCSPAYHQQVFRHYYELLHRDDIQSASLLCARAFAGFAGNEARYLVTAAIHAEGSIPGMTELYGVSIARGLAVRPVMRRLIDFLNAIDVQVWIVSASPEIAVETAMQRFDLPGNLIALRNKLDEGILSTQVVAPYSIGEGKVDCVRASIDDSARPVLAIGDSIHDLPMLAYADIPSVVDCSEKLTKEARRRGWYVLPVSAA